MFTSLRAKKFSSLTAISVAALFGLSACGVGTVNQQSSSSASAAATTSAPASDSATGSSETASQATSETAANSESAAANENNSGVSTALAQAEKALKDSASDNPKSITGASTAESVAEVQPIDNPQQPSLPVTFKDFQGTEVTVNSADRILALDLYGTLAETVIGLGLGDNLVGRVTSSTESSLADLPLVTQNGHDLNAEAIIALAPTVVLMDTTNGPVEITEQLRSAGITVVHFDPARTMDGIVPQIQAVADALGVPDSGKRLGERVQKELDSVISTISDIAPTAEDQKIKMAFLYVRGTAGVFFILGDGSGADDLITALSGIDAASEGGASGTTPATSEALVNINPDLILTMTNGIESTGGYSGFLQRPGVAETNAGKNGRIVDMSDGQILSFGPNTAAVLLSLAQAVYGPAETNQVAS